MRLPLKLGYGTGSGLSARRIQLLLGTGLGVILPGGLYAVSAVRYMARCGEARSSCREHRKAGCTIDGEYNIRFGGSEIEATCDMHTDGGGWTLVGNYLRRGRTTPPVSPNPLQDRLPIQESTTLGQDETGSPTSWGHLAPDALSQLPFAEVRFFCRTSTHPTHLDFVIADPHCLDYFRSGRGMCINPQTRATVLAATRVLAGHEGAIPRDAGNGWKDQGYNALVNYPFYPESSAHYWSIATTWNRFECDDQESGGQANTFHQIWVR